MIIFCAASSFSSQVERQLRDLKEQGQGKTQSLLQEHREKYAHFIPCD